MRENDPDPGTDAAADEFDDGRSETPNERADRNWNEILQELRVAQTGAQILGAFLLAVAFQPRFTELDRYQLTLYLVLVALAGIAAALGLAPVSLHRAHFGQRQKARIVRIGDRLLVADLVVLALLAAGVTSLIFDFTLGRTAGLAALGGGAVVILALWALVPRLGIRARAR
ncbi:DUF6328 family protein [Leucobacter sp. wl10]|uniref:DUF6328 family protein n=1 Tax=Leucobacter sp. wl10 TaxID=2304677 RepID=UPI000E5A1A43|nr:DUF6328 family protein [Leucobacter sp. wl10]RGE15843.1 sodium:proton antiporter [Leucobacter sp. wl10]